MKEFLMIAAAVCLGAQANAWMTLAVNYAIGMRQEKRRRAALAAMFGVGSHGPAPAADVCACINCGERRKREASTKAASVN